MTRYFLVYTTIKHTFRHLSQTQTLLRPKAQIFCDLMAAEPMKRKRVENSWRMKLLVGEKVEVRSEEDGLLGSWHLATVINCSKNFRTVKYENIVKEEGGVNLVEAVPVSSIIVGGARYRDASQCQNRGKIRPLPPPFEFLKWNLHYGFCVDAYYNEAWWEGVIFDKNDGAEERRIFFPDLGDEMAVKVESLRITQDWEEATEEWHTRGTWLFLELMENFKLELYIPVSEKQIWYDLQEKDGFEKLKDWTSSERSPWEELLMEVITDNIKFFSDSVSQDVLPDAINPSNTKNRLIENVSEDVPAVLQSLPPELPEENCRLLAGRDIDPGAEICPDVITKYVQCGKKSQRYALSVDVKKHLNHLNWKIVCRRDEKGLFKQRYVSPDGKCFDSLVLACLNLIDPSVKIPSMIPQDGKRVLCIAPDSPLAVDSSSLPCDAVFDILEYKPEAIIDWGGIDENCQSGDIKSGFAKEVRKYLSAKGWVFKRITIGAIKPLCCFSPGGRCYYSLRSAWEALLDGEFAKESTIVCNKIKDRSASPGFSHPVSNTEFEESLEPSRILSKKLSVESSSIAQPKNLKTEREINLSQCLGIQATSNNASLPKIQGEKKSSRAASLGFSHPVSNAEFEEHLEPSRILSKKSSVESSSIAQPKNLKTEREIIPSQCLGIQASSNNASLPKIQGEKKSSRAADLVGSRKRVSRQFKTPSQRHPLTVLSWMIDNDIVLARQKVFYCSGSNPLLPNAEGRLTREGIKCNCCRNIYTLTSFEAHVGSSSSSPASHIFLKDGKSLLDCQLEALRKGNYFIGGQHDELEGNHHHHQVENDPICSVCHYGGEIILCDGCPSSYHGDCLGLKDVPDGDWFCPLCCCGICGSGFRRGTENVLTCYQCEHKYHGACLLKSRADISAAPSTENWFCSAKCQEIFLGLQNLVGKKILIGKNNLTWTLIRKSNQLDIHRLDASDIETLSKLDLALSVMHECFEPVKTGRDVVEDSIYSRGSEIKRFNFRGFYTILLERDEELVSVATVRVFGEKAAEIPLVGTRFRCRRLGMCRFLMDELEKNLMELGVQRLILPAVPKVVDTWTSSFGFSQMTHSERIDFLDHTFLDFRGTILCQKLLLKSPPSAPLKQPRGKFLCPSYLSCPKGRLNIIQNDESITVSSVE